MPVKVKEVDDETGISREHWELQTPPFENPLNKQVDKAGWWRINSPLYLQTPALGPTDTNRRLNISSDDMSNKGLSFQGVRVVSVTNNLISRIDTVTVKDMRAATGGR